MTLLSEVNMNIENVITSLCEKFSVTVAQLSSAVISYQKVSTGVATIISFSLCLIFGFAAYLAYKKLHNTQDSNDTWKSVCLVALAICACSFFVFVFAFANFCIWSLAPEGAFVDYLVGLVN